MSTLCLCVSLLEQCSCGTHGRAEDLVLLLAGEVQHHNPRIPRGCSVYQDMSIIHQTDKLVGLPPDWGFAIRADAHVSHLEAHFALARSHTHYWSTNMSKLDVQCCSVQLVATLFRLVTTDLSFVTNLVPKMFSVICVQH